MTSSANGVLQLAAVCTAVVLRATSTGWLLLLAILPATIAVVAQIRVTLDAMAITGRLPRRIALPFVGVAFCEVGAALVIADVGDAAHSERSPLGLLLGLPTPPPLNDLGLLLVLGLVIALYSVTVAVRDQPTPA